MPPALRAVLTSSCVTLGLQSSIRPLTRSVTAGPGGIRGSAPHHGIELWRSYIASGLADPGCPVSPSLHQLKRSWYALRVGGERLGWLETQGVPVILPRNRGAGRKRAGSAR